MPVHPKDEKRIKRAKTSLENKGETTKAGSKISLLVEEGKKAVKSKTATNGKPGKKNGNSMVEIDEETKDTTLLSINVSAAKLHNAAGTRKMATTQAAVMGCSATKVCKRSRCIFFPHSQCALFFLPTSYISPPLVLSFADKGCHVSPDIRLLNALSGWITRRRRGRQRPMPDGPGRHTCQPNGSIAAPIHGVVSRARTQILHRCRRTSSLARGSAIRS